MWDIIRLFIRAERSGSWIEALCLSYTLMEVELRLLLSSKDGKSGTPVAPELIDEQRYLMNLANLAKSEGFIADDLWTKIQDFNEIRRKVIHRFITGEVTYEQLKQPALEASQIIGAIQDRWLPIEWGKEESVRPATK